MSVFGLRGTRSVLCAAIPMLIWASAQGQEKADSVAGTLSWEYAEEPSGVDVFRWLGEHMTPVAVRDARRIRSYVRDPRFDALRRREGDLRAADAIYLRALRIAEYDIGRALFLSLLASLEHRMVALQLPIAGPVGLPLTFEEEDLFRARVQHLPRRLYPDTPDDDHGDRDKLQHFFGAASVAYSTESPDAASTVGALVEWGEAAIVVGGVDDPRDRRSNVQGEMFGHDLLYVQTMLPSDYLKLPVPVE